MATVYSPNEEFHLKIRPGDVGRYVLLCGDPARTEKIAATARETAMVPDELPTPIKADDDLIDNAEEMADEYDFLYIAIHTEEDAQTVLDAAPFLSLPIAVCGEPSAIAYLKRRYCGKLVTVADNS